MDTSRIWLDAFSLSPLPSMVIATSAQDTTSETHHILFANSSCTAMTGQDLEGITHMSLEALLGLDAEMATSLASSMAAGCQFVMPLKDQKMGVYEAQEYVVLLPLCDIAGSGHLIAHLAIFLHGPGVQYMCHDKLAGMVTVQELKAAHYRITATAAGKKVIRLGLFATKENSAADAAAQAAECQQGLQQAYKAVASSRAKGSRPLSALPAALDPVGWLQYFELLLTSATGQAV
jgi:hypothetical protein